MTALNVHTSITVQYIHGEENLPKALEEAVEVARRLENSVTFKWHRPNFSYTRTAGDITVVIHPDTAVEEALRHLIS